MSAGTPSQLPNKDSQVSQSGTNVASQVSKGASSKGGNPEQRNSQVLDGAEDSASDCTQVRPTQTALEKSNEGTPKKPSQQAPHHASK